MLSAVCAELPKILSIGLFFSSELDEIVFKPTHAALGVRYAGVSLVVTGSAQLYGAHTLIHFRPVVAPLGPPKTTCSETPTARARSKRDERTKEPKEPNQSIRNSMTLREWSGASRWLRAAVSKSMQRVEIPDATGSGVSQSGRQKLR